MAKDKSKETTDQQETEEDTPVYHDISQEMDKDASEENQPMSEDELTP